MNSAIIDNAIGADITRCITWQFDKATRLVGIITALKDFYDQSTGELWDGMIDSVENIDEANDYGLSVWGKILNVRRPVVNDGTSLGPISSDAYRKILKGRFALMNGNAELGIVGNASMSDYVKYVNYIFDGKVSVKEGPGYSTPEAMSMTFADNGLDGELLDLFTNHKDIAFLYPCGVHDNSKSSSLRFGLDPSHTTHRSDRGGLGESSFTWN